MIPVERLPLAEVGSKLVQRGHDLLICSSSFERRCRSIPDNLDRSAVRRALIVTNVEPKEFVKENDDYLKELFGGEGKLVEVSRTDPLRTADSFKESLHKTMQENNPKSLLIDITTFTHETLLIVLGILRADCRGKRLTVAYANAQAYDATDSVEEKWLSKGVAKVRSVLGFPGGLSPSQLNHLIVVVGYEHERAGRLIELLEPSSIALGFGRSGSATTDKNRDANEHYHRLVARMASSYGRVISFEIPCNDPSGTCDALGKQIEDARGQNVILAPMSNKLSTVGCALAAFEHPEVQLCYAQPLSYNYANYSVPGNTCYVLDLSSILVPEG